MSDIKFIAEQLEIPAKELEQTIAEKPFELLEETWYKITAKVKEYDSSLGQFHVTPTHKVNNAEAVNNFLEYLKNNPKFSRKKEIVDMAEASRNLIAQIQVLSSASAKFKAGVILYSMIINSFKNDKKLSNRIAQQNQKLQKIERKMKVAEETAKKMANLMKGFEEMKRLAEIKEEAFKLIEENVEVVEAPQKRVVEEEGVEPEEEEVEEEPEEVGGGLL